MKVTAPTCTVKGTSLTIAVTDGNDGINPGEKWSTFLMKFLISATNPKDYLGTAAKVTGKITKPGSTTVIATAPSVDVTGSTVEKLTTGKDTVKGTAGGDASAKMGWGYDPLSTAAETYLGGIRADHHCIVTKVGDGATGVVGNCINKSDGTTGLPIANINALELTWTLPSGYDIPNDGTTATMTCNSEI